VSEKQEGCTGDMENGRNMRHRDHNISSIAWAGIPFTLVTVSQMKPQFTLFYDEKRG